MSLKPQLMQGFCTILHPSLAPDSFFLVFSSRLFWLFAFFQQALIKEKIVFILIIPKVIFSVLNWVVWINKFAEILLEYIPILILLND